MLSAAAQTVTITVHAEKPGIAIPGNFLGLSMETKDLAYAPNDTGCPSEPTCPEPLNLNNVVYQRMIARLAPGVLRISGDSADTIAWQRGTRTANTPPNTLVSSDVDSAFAFARATGFQMLFGLNMATGTPAMAADEAAYMFQSGGSALWGFEIGNEPDLWQGLEALKPAGYSVTDYIEGYPAFANAVQAETPQALLAGPATTFGAIKTWTPPFVQQLGSRMAMITQHFYPLSPTTASVAALLSAGTWQTADQAGAYLQGLVAGVNRPWRMAEMNSVNYAGQPGVTDAFVSALWIVDCLFTLANRGAAGVNVYGDGNKGNFSVVVAEANNVATARPLYYGMLMFHLAAQGRLVPLDLVTNGINLTAYGALDTDGTLRVTVINKDLSNNASVHLTPGGRYTSATVMRLAGPSLSSLTGTTLAGAQVAADGSWTPGTLETVAGASGVFTSTVPSGSAALFSFAGSSFPRPLHGRPRLRP
jgi:hypothetical protein